MLLIVSLIAGCASAPSRKPAIDSRDATAVLLVHPEFKAAANAAPKWVGDALQVITKYEAELSAKN